ncbi:uncharacterized protein TNCV_820091 [Trichonephila clavipes]|nr:uncharacterized protein TNCV_820091 [Trichonephila clavipes]
MLVGTSKDYSMRQDEICEKSISLGKDITIAERGMFTSKVLEVQGHNLTIWKSGKRMTVNIDQVRVYRPRQTDTVSSDSQVETLYDEQGVSHGSNRSNQGQFKEHRKTSSKESEGCRSRQGPSRLPDCRLNKSTKVGSRTEGSGRDNMTRQTRATTRGRNKQAERPVRSNQATTRRPCPMYLRSQVKESDGIPEEQRNIEINGIPHNKIRRRSLSMEALDGDLATGSSLTQNPSRSQSEIQGDLHKVVFQNLQFLSHPGISATANLIAKCFFWPGMRKDIKNRDRPCEKCQRAKVFKHTKAPLSTFAHIHIDYIGPYPPSKGYKYCLTIIDRNKPAYEFSEDFISQKGSSKFEPPLTKQQIEDKTVVDKNIRTARSGRHVHFPKRLTY